jgi:hypothetical protein
LLGRARRGKKAIYGYKKGSLQKLFNEFLVVMGVGGD